VLPEDSGQQRVFVLFALAAVGTLGWLVARRASLRRTHLDDTDRKLAFALALVVLYPLTVLLHEWGHVLAVRLTGGHVESIDFSFIEGATRFVPAGRPSGTEAWFVAISGTVVQLLVVLLYARLGWRARRTPNLLRLALMVAASASAVQALIIYPLASQDGGGDFAIIYGESTPLVLRVLTVAAHAAAVLHLLRDGREHLEQVLARVR
jgi:hypothetical protein